MITRVYTKHTPSSQTDGQRADTTFSVGTGARRACAGNLSVRTGEPRRIYDALSIYVEYLYTEQERERARQCLCRWTRGWSETMLNARHARRSNFIASTKRTRGRLANKLAGNQQTVASANQRYLYVHLCIYIFVPPLPVQALGHQYYGPFVWNTHAEYVWMHHTRRPALSPHRNLFIVRARANRVCTLKGRL